jgi:hypothetical protein
VPFGKHVQGTTVQEMAANGQYVSVFVPPDAQPGSMLTYQY